MDRVSSLLTGSGVCPSEVAWDKLQQLATKTPNMIKSSECFVKKGFVLLVPLGTRIWSSNGANVVRITSDRGKRSLLEMGPFQVQTNHLERSSVWSIPNIGEADVDRC